MVRRKLYFIAALVWVALSFESAFSLDFNSLTDQSSYRCSEAVVASGDSERSVREKCGDPIATAAVPDYGPIWIYGREGDRFMYYLEFGDGKLQRILAASCSIDDPLCFDLR